MGEAEKLWWHWLNEGWKYRGIGKFPKADRVRYKDQIVYESKEIIGKDFVDYFLVMSDLIRGMKDRGIPVGPGRGSSAGSLCMYLLRITEIDPMLFPVMQFERFIDPNRFDDPDVDTDFDDDFRDVVRQMAVEKYGENRVGNIGTFTRYKAKNSLDDIARVYNLPRFEVDSIKDFILERTAGDDSNLGHDLEDTVAAFPQVKKIFDKYPELYQAIKLEGNLKNFGIHAAGIVIGAAPLSHSVAAYARKDEKTKLMRQVLSVDKFDGEHLGLLKLDALGLKTMGMIRIALEDIGMSLEELYRIPLDDPKTLALFERCDVTGIFQFEGNAARETTKQIIPKNFMDLAAINTLARPGPLHSGSTGDYIQIRHGRMERHDPHPLFASITAETEGQIIYQEQMVQLVREIGNFDWKDATTVRKNIAKSKGADSFRPLWEKFRDGAATHGIDEAGAADIWGRLTAAGAYAFNAAHAVSYSALGFWCAWLKAHHPLSFYMAQLQKLDPNSPTGKERIPQLLRDAAEHGFKVKPPSLKHSRSTWTHTKDSLIAGWTQIKGIGPAQSTSIEALREEMGGFTSWDDLRLAKGIGPAKIKEILAMAEHEDPFGVNYISKQTAEIKRAIKRGEMADCPMPDTLVEDIPYEAETSFHIVCVTVNKRMPKNLYEQHKLKHGEPLDPTTVKNPELADYMTLHTEDVSGPVTISVNRNIFPRFKEELEGLRLGKDFLVVQAKKMNSYGKILLASDMWPISIEE